MVPGARAVGTNLLYPEVLLLPVEDATEGGSDQDEYQRPEHIAGVYGRMCYCCARVPSSRAPAMATRCLSPYTNACVLCDAAQR